MIDFSKKPKGTGNVFYNKTKTSDKQPDKTGTVELPKELLKELVEEVKAGGTPTLRIAQWDRVSKEKQTPYMYTTLETPIKNEEPKAEVDDIDLPF